MFDQDRVNSKHGGGGLSDANLRATSIVLSGLERLARAAAAKPALVAPPTSDDSDTVTLAGLAEFVLQYRAAGTVELAFHFNNAMAIFTR